MKQKMYFWLAAMLLMVSVVGSAQEKECVVDNIEVDTIDVDYVINENDSVFADSAKITQYDLSECEGLEVCPPSKYAIVTKDGMKGIYDMKQGTNVTEIEYREIVFSRSEELADGVPSSWFYAKKGNQMGILCVYEDDNSVMAIWGDDPDED